MALGEAAMPMKLKRQHLIMEMMISFALMTKLEAKVKRKRTLSITKDLAKEGALVTTLQNEASFMETQCLYCVSEATSCCLDCGPSMSLRESCSVEKHRTVHIFHNVEILKVRNKFNLSSKMNTCCSLSLFDRLPLTTVFL